MAQNSLNDSLSHRNKRQKTNHQPIDVADLWNVVPALTDEQWLSVLKMIWSVSSPLIASSLSYCVRLKGLNWTLQQAKAAIPLQTACAVLNGLVLKRGLSQTAVQLYDHIQEQFGLILQPANEGMQLKNPFVFYRQGE